MTWSRALQFPCLWPVRLSLWLNMLGHWRLWWAWGLSWGPNVLPHLHWAQEYAATANKKWKNPVSNLLLLLLLKTSKKGALKLPRRIQLIVYIAPLQKCTFLNHILKVLFSTWPHQRLVISSYKILKMYCHYPLTSLFLLSSSSHSFTFLLRVLGYFYPLKHLSYHIPCLTWKTNNEIMLFPHNFNQRNTYKLISSQT